MKSCKFFKMLLLVLLFTSISSITALAEETDIHSITVDVVLNQDGSADITEIWNIDNVFDGTEYYLPLYNTDEMVVSDFKVRDDSGQEYTSLSTWDTDMSFDEKAYKCGILNVKKGYELCWGISEMGDRTYTISYHITNLVKGYTDQDGFYYQFITNDISSSPNEIFVRISMVDTYFSSDNAQIWSFGYPGEVQFEDGSITARSTKELRSSDYVNLLVSFRDGIFTLPVTDKTFSSVKEKAFDQASFEKWVLPVVLGILVGIILLIVLITYIYTRKLTLADGTKIRRTVRRKAEICTTLPFGNSIPAVCAAAQMDHTAYSFEPLSAYLIKWQLSGVIRFETKTAKDGKPGKPIILLTGNPSDDYVEKTLFSYLSKAARNKKLTMSAWKSWTGEHYKKLEKWNRSVIIEGNKILVSSGWGKPSSKQKMRFTPSGYDAYVKMLGFYNYLKSFNKTTRNIDTPQDYWGDYLVYAALFKFTDNVVGAFKAGAPKDFDNFCDYYGMNSFTFLYCIHHSHGFSATAATAVSSGDGGSSFSGGGGGFSGGGGGGGSR